MGLRPANAKGYGFSRRAQLFDRIINIHPTERFLLEGKRHSRSLQKKP
jgi:hypothetical protein